MVRVCLYLALALGLAGSAEAACTPSGLTAANGFAVTGGNVYAAGGTNVGESCAIDVTAVTASEGCSIQCKAGFFITSDARVNGNIEWGWVHCDSASALTSPTCTACTAVEDMTVNAAEPTCTSATTSQVSSCLTGFFFDETGDADVCTAWKSQKNCDVDAATQQGATAYLACTTAKAGYKVTAGLVGNCVDDLCFGMDTFNSEDKPSKATGVTCKNDGTVIRIPSCPDGTFKTAGTATTSDTCTACLDTGKSRCHCTGATAALCLATGSCASGYTGYEGDGAGKASKSTGCKACKACTATSTASKVAQWTSAECTTSSDYGCTDCPAVTTNGKKAGASCYNAAFTNNACATGFDQLPGQRISTDKGSTGQSAKLGCGKSTCVCPSGSFTGGTATAPTCTAWTAYAASKYETTPGTATANRVLATCGATDKTGCAASTYKVLGTTVGKANCGAAKDHVCKACTVCTGAGGVAGGNTQTGWSVACDLDSDTPAANEGAGTDTSCSLPKKDHTWTAFAGVKRTYKIHAASATANALKLGEVTIFDGTDCTSITAGLDNGGATLGEDTFSDGVDATSTTAGTVAETNAVSITAAGTSYLCIRAASSTTAGHYINVGTITTKAAGKSCLVQDWTKSHDGKCHVTLATNTNGVTTPGGTTLAALGVVRRSGFQTACTVTCDETDGPFTVGTPAVACTQQKGCTKDGSSGDCADDGNTNPREKLYRTYLACTTPDTGYYLTEDTTDHSTSPDGSAGKYDVVKSCVGAGQSTLTTKGGVATDTVSCSDICWYTGACKTGYTKTVGMGVSDTCVSDSAASVSLTAVLLSVVAKIFLF